MPLENTTDTAPESQLSAPESHAAGPLDTGAEVTNEREFEQSFTSAAEAAPPAAPAAKPAQPAAPAAPAAAAPPPRPAAQPVTPEQWQQAQAEIARYRQMAAVGERYAAHAPDIDQFLSERQQQQRQEQQAAQQAQEFNREQWLKEQWKLPEFTDQMQAAIDRGLVEMDERGMYVPAQGMELLVAPILQGLNDYTQQHQQTVRGLFKGNFPEKVLSFVEKPLMHAVEKLLDERISQFQKNTRVEKTLEQLERQLIPVIHATDPTTGAQTLTPDGQRFIAVLQKLETRYPDTPQDELLQLATEFAGISLNQSAGQGAAVAATPHGSAAPPAPTPAPAPTEVSEEKKRSFLEKATARPAAGTQASPHAQPEGPVFGDQADLDNFFSRQFAAANAS